MAFSRRTLGGRSWIDYDAQWLSLEHASELMGQLTTVMEWGQYPIKVFGQDIMQPRLIAWAGALPYSYSGQTLEPRIYPPVLAQLQQQVIDATGIPFNHAFLNRYRNGQDHLGYHADDEPELGESPQIAAVSLGAKRKFVLQPRPKKLRHRKVIYQLEHGSLMLMGGRIQHAWRHGVPKQGSIEQERINVTFRWIKEDLRQLSQ